MISATRLLLFLFFASAFSQAQDAHEDAPKKDVLAELKAREGHGTFAAALADSGLLTPKAGEKKAAWIVLAPSDTAFEKLPWDSLPKERQLDILKLHLSQKAVDLTKPGASFQSLAGKAHPVSVREGRLRVGGTALLTTNIPCTDGTLYLTDIPLSANPTLLESLHADETFSVFRLMVELGGLNADLTRKTYTLFAPTDTALLSLPNLDLESMISPGQEDALEKFLKAHIVDGAFMLEQLAKKSTPGNTLAGHAIPLEKTGDTFRFGLANMEQTPRACANGNLYALTSVAETPKADPPKVAAPPAPVPAKPAPSAPKPVPEPAPTPAPEPAPKKKPPSKPETQPAPPVEAKPPPKPVPTRPAPNIETKPAPKAVPTTPAPKPESKPKAKPETKPETKPNSGKDKKDPPGKEDTPKDDPDDSDTTDEEAPDEEKAKPPHPGIALIERTVRIGGGLYNTAHRKASVDLFEMTCQTLLKLDPDLLPADVKSELELAIDDAKAETALDKKAWALRKALDDARDGLLFTGEDQDADTKKSK